MKAVLRVLLFLITLVLLVGVAAILSLLVRIPWLSRFTVQSVLAYPWLTLAFAIVLAIFILATLVALVLIVAMPSKSGIYTLHRDMGKLEITRQSIESGAGITLDSFAEVKRYDVKALGDLSPGKVKLDIIAETKGTTNFETLGQQIQTRVAADLASSLGMEPGNVQVRMRPYTPHARDEKNSRVPRVR